MKRKTIFLFLGGVMLALFILGAAGLVSLGSGKDGAEGAGTDRLIGVFITREYLDLFDFEQYFNENADKILSGGEISPEESAEYSGRLYAVHEKEALKNEETGEKESTDKFVFPGVEGISYFVVQTSDENGSCSSSQGDEAISDGGIHLSYTDEGDDISMEAVIYISTEAENSAFYFNPVYQTAGGEIYAVSGSGTSFSGESASGMSHSAEFNEESSQTLNGETKTQSCHVSVTVSYMDPPEKTILTQFDGENRVLLSEEYAPGMLPEGLETVQGAQYIIVETISGDSRARRLYQPEDQGLDSFLCREDGIIIKRYTNLTWN